MIFYALTIEALDGANAPVTLRFAASRYVDALGNDFKVRLKQAALFRNAAFSGAVLTGSRSGFGEAILRNEDGGLDFLADYAVDGRNASVFLINGTSQTEVLRGTVRELAFQNSEVSVRLRDPQEELSLPHPQEFYAGSNIAPDGLEGEPGTIQGTRKPIVFGRVENCEPVLVNAQKLIFQVSSKPCAVSAVYDRGVALTRGADYATLLELESIPPTPGQFRAINGYFRLGSSPIGPVYADALAPTTLLGDVFGQVCSDVGFSFLGAGVLNPFGDCGVYLREERTTADILDELSQSAGAYWTFNLTKQINAALLQAPASPVSSIEDYQMIEISRDATGAGQNKLPVWQVTVNADRLVATQNEFAAAVTDERKARLLSGSRQAISSSPLVKSRHPLSDELVINSALRSITNAQTVANRLGLLLGTRRDSVRVVARLTDVSILEIGVNLTLKTKRLGYSAGRVMTVLGFTIDAQRNRVELDLWG